VYNTITSYNVRDAKGERKEGRDFSISEPDFYGPKGNTIGHCLYNILLRRMCACVCVCVCVCVYLMIPVVILICFMDIGKLLFCLLVCPGENSPK
jgi:hypothetical protein